MSAYSLSIFEDQLNNILQSLDLKPKEVKEIQDSLVKSVYIDLINQFLLKLSELNQEQSQVFMQEVKLLSALNLEDKANLDHQDLKQHLETIELLVAGLDFDFNTALVDSAQKVFNGFLVKISTNLSEDEVEKLKTIFVL